MKNLSFLYRFPAKILQGKHKSPGLKQKFLQHRVVSLNVYVSVCFLPSSLGNVMDPINICMCSELHYGKGTQA